MLTLGRSRRPVLICERGRIVNPAQQLHAAAKSLWLDSISRRMVTSGTLAGYIDESGPGTNPEEFLGAAHDGCFSMALALGLTQAGHPPTRITTSARVGIEKTGSGFRIPRIDLTTEAEVVPGLDETAFHAAAEQAKSGCPVSVALSATEIHLEAKLVG